ncbi:hypothetical protein AeRB84_005021 [Aphanomyces euteiches]|nr:hypothetical protein AeRB84_006055 [Aphanomyces euteiches]KAH9152566.1 hypothetical protein AeRB84_005021 [Aphanomyces euteiches]
MSRPDKDKWLSAAEDEFRSLISNGTYDLVRRDSSQKVLPCRWVFRLKPGSIYKARLVVKGFMQEHGVDYTEIFAPVVRLEVLRLLFTLAAVYDLECHQMDVKTAFLNGKIDCLIFMEQPPGSFVSSKSRRDYVCRLKKRLYGLKQAPHLCPLACCKTRPALHQWNSFSRPTPGGSDFIHKPILSAYVDADYANCKDTRRCVSGYVLLLLGSPISWLAKKQNIVTLSTTEAEFVALALCIQECLYIQQLASELKQSSDQPVIFYEDNQSTIHVAQNSEHHGRSKHIDVRYMFVRDLVEAKHFELRYRNTKNQLADFFTKAHPEPAFKSFCKSLRLLSLAEFTDSGGSIPLHH